MNGLCLNTALCPAWVGLVPGGKSCCPAVWPQGAVPLNPRLALPRAALWKLLKAALMSEAFTPRRQEIREAVSCWLQPTWTEHSGQCLDEVSY